MLRRGSNPPFVTPDLIRGPAALIRDEEAGCRIKSGMTAEFLRL
jgi:hypothetical protein